ncbi:SDR family NAD(P)-dependent oxidoreductase [Hydrogenophaga sp.]|uniref:SDR family NAD(P)-dependent oxidoreductase n=1 Tax=Hydrogenophaga sp. TaxID=1904254 RepID=UPI0026328095|nr:SDR family NAD(P)-dependent oxidoreductase [Hydrogenophaga sp.]MCW5654341.1 SDR family NAD(P)-dependent oxidoreductase [Hydrogenophaga sp.]
MKKDMQTVLITGACGNLGKAVAQMFSSNGWTLVLLDREQAQLNSVFGTDGERQLSLAANLLDAASVQSAVQQALQRFGRIDVLCNLAGGFRMGEPVHETSDGTWDFLMGLNVRSVLHTARAVVPAMLAAGGGRIVNIGAGAAGKGGANMGAYAASKSAVARLTESMSAELRERGINVNCVLPSIIDTPENRKDMPKADPSRWVSPASLAGVIAFLASDAARDIHGASVPVSGLS